LILQGEERSADTAATGASSPAPAISPSSNARRGRSIPALATEPQTVHLDADAQARAGIVVRPVLERRFGDQFRIVGQVVRSPGSTVPVKVVVPGRIEKILATPGSRVEKGQPVLLMHSHALHGLQADDLRAREQLRMAQIQVEAGRRLLELEGIPGVEFGFTQPIQMRVDEPLSGVKSQIAVKIFGDDLPTLASLGGRVADLLRTVRGAADVKVEAIEGLGYLEITMQRQRMARLGVSVAQVRQVIETAIGGKAVTTVPEGDRRTDVVVRLPRAYSARVENLRDLPLLTPSGERVLLREVARIDLVAGPARISRENGKRRVVVELNVVGRDIGGFVEEARRLIDENVEMPTGYFVTWGGQFEQQQRAMARLKVMVPVAFLLIFILLYLNFRSTRPVWLILANIPLALVGGVVGLKLSGMYLSVSASVGFIALFGIAILNGLVMVEFFQNLEAAGMPRRQAVLEGAELRLRPVLMTAATTALGLVPMIWASGVGSEVQRPLAVVVVSGVVTSTLLTLLALPVLYTVFGRGGAAGEGSCDVPAGSAARIER